MSKLETKIPKTQQFEMHLLALLTSRNFAGLSLLTSKIYPEISDRYVQNRQFYRKVCEMPKNAGTERPLKCEIGHVTSLNLLGDVISSYLDTDQVSSLSDNSLQTHFGSATWMHH